MRILCVYTCIYSFHGHYDLDSHFETQTTSFFDSMSCARIVTNSAKAISDHHESGLSRVVCNGEIADTGPYVHMCAQLHLTRHSRLKLQCLLNPKANSDRDGINNVMKSSFIVRIDPIRP